MGADEEMRKVAALKNEIKELNRIIDALKKDVVNAETRSDDEVKDAFEIVFSRLRAVSLEASMESYYGASTLNLKLAGDCMDLNFFMGNLVREIKSRCAK